MDKYSEEFERLPAEAKDYIEAVVKNVRYRKKIRKDVRAELTGHFADALKDAPDEGRTELCRRLIDAFGDEKLLGALIRRGKKRCRPMWVKVLRRMAAAAGVFIAFFVLYVIWFINGDPVPTVDYIERLNQAARPEVKDADNAWPLLVEAVQNYVEIEEEHNELSGKRINELNDDELEIIRQWLAQNSKSIELFRHAAGKPYCYREYAVTQTGAADNEVDNLYDGSLLSMLVPHLADIRKVTRLVHKQGRIAAAEGDYDSALDIYSDIMKVGKGMMTMPVIIEQLVGIAISAMGVAEIKNLVAGDVTEDFLVTVGSRVDEIYEKGIPGVDFTFEKYTMFDLVQRCFTDGGPGGGHIVPKYASVLMKRSEIDIKGEGNSLIEETFESAAFLSISLYHAGRRDTLVRAHKVYSLLESISDISPYQRKVGGYQEKYEQILLDSKRYWLVWMIFPALEKVVELNYRMKTDIEVLRVVTAAKLYEKRSGSLPANMNELVEAGYIDSLPADPYSDGKLVYKLTEDGFMIYSFGPDFDDDGGRWYIDSKGQKRTWARRRGDDGDSVLWPAQD